MLERNPEISREPLWEIPAPIQDRLQSRLRDREYTRFLLCGLYSVVAVSFLLMFGLSAWSRSDTSFALIIFAFAMATVGFYLLAWYTGMYSYTKHYLTVLMGLLCLYLFYTGGTVNTGPLYYFIFPLVAVFLQGLRFGVVSVVVLLLLTVALEAGAFGFDPGRYSDIFMIRILAIYTIISMLAFVSEYFRLKAERELLLSIYDLNQVTFGDLTTNLANRRLMEKLLVSEANRAKRYSGACSVMMIEPDIAHEYGINQRTAVRVILAQVLRNHLRPPDIPGIWDESRFLVLLPETSLSGAATVGERLLAEFQHQLISMSGNSPRPLTVSIGIAALVQRSADEVVEAATDLMLQARREGGNRLSVES